jgi:hypothetical protein
MLLALTLVSEEHCAVLCKMTYSVAERVVIVEAYINTGSIKETPEIFWNKFPGRREESHTGSGALRVLWPTPQNKDPLQFARQKLLTTFAKSEEVNT